MRTDIDDPEPDILVDGDLHLDDLWGRANGPSRNGSWIRAIACSLFVSAGEEVDSRLRSPEWRQRGVWQETDRQLHLLKVGSAHPSISSIRIEGINNDLRVFVPVISILPQIETYIQSIR